ncbi:MAG TPA: ABC transporter permease subunit [Chloroflexota bacterium]|nr:ABC transporter permease subunit [Chloroflexota bacterium]
MWSAVLAKEFSSRLQSRVAYAVLTILVASFSALTLGAFWLLVSTVPTIVPVIGSSVGSGGGTTLPTLVVGYRGVFLFIAMGLSLLCALFVIAPAISSSAISSEREQGTFDILISSGASGRGVILGKVVAAGLFIALLLLTTAPGFSVAWYYGGVGWGEIIPALAVTLTSLWLLVCFGVFISAFTRSSMLAALYAYCGVFLLAFGTLGVYIIGASLQMEAFVRPLLILNPFASLVTVPEAISTQVAQVLPFQYRALLDQPMVELGGLPLRLPRWTSTSIVFLLAGLILTLITAIVVDPCDGFKARLTSRVSRAGEQA